MKAVLEQAEITRRVRRNAFSGVTQLDFCWSSGQVNGLVMLAFKKKVLFPFRLQRLTTSIHLTVSRPSSDRCVSRRRPALEGHKKALSSSEVSGPRIKK